ncbi:hypothetical protein [Halorientalis regularis]|jgi:hypothetical protein|uniref:Uncharacterized protein n=1 Tax=Halorientalis regularis TaxID=660518 RepID=A0A1G7N5I0_9EURY|nr:hypothetical protein [Halorientalis regularis]SDF68590.1 hypothetical protein SAMN05216218_108170 [Halorientalis regularis]
MTTPRSERGRGWVGTVVSSLPTPVGHTLSLQVRSVRFLRDLPSLAALYLAVGVLASVAPTYLTSLELLAAKFVVSCPVLAVTYLAVADWTGVDPQTPISFVQGTVVGSAVVAVPLLPISLATLALLALLGGDVASVVPGVWTTGMLELYLAPLYPLLLYLLVSSSLIVPAAIIDRARPTFAGSLGWKAVRHARWTVVGALLATGLVAGAFLAGFVGLVTALQWLSTGTAPTLDFAFARRVVYEVGKWLFVVTLGMLYVDQRPRERDGAGYR